MVPHELLTEQPSPQQNRMGWLALHRSKSERLARREPQLAHRKVQRELPNKLLHSLQRGHTKEQPRKRARLRFCMYLGATADPSNVLQKRD